MLPELRSCQTYGVYYEDQWQEVACSSCSTAHFLQKKKNKRLTTNARRIPFIS